MVVVVVVVAVAVAVVVAVRVPAAVVVVVVVVVLLVVVLEGVAVLELVRELGRVPVHRAAVAAAPAPAAATRRSRSPPSPPPRCPSTPVTEFPFLAPSYSTCLCSFTPYRMHRGRRALLLHLSTLFATLLPSCEKQCGSHRWYVSSQRTVAVCLPGPAVAVCVLPYRAVVWPRCVGVLAQSWLRAHLC